jgi:predicted transcriptional regulator YdeE
MPQNLTPQIVEFGPYRVIGVAMIGPGDGEAMKALWHDAFSPRIDEVQRLEGTGFAVGLCRCLPDATDGTFEYIAAIPAATDAPVPAGMIEAPIAAATYAAFPVDSVFDIAATWAQIGPWLEAHPEWNGYCTPAGCQCATHPGFEMYPPSCHVDGKLFIYIPVRRAGM